MYELVLRSSSAERGSPLTVALAAPKGERELSMVGGMAGEWLRLGGERRQWLKSEPPCEYIYVYIRTARDERGMMRCENNVGSDVDRINSLVGDGHGQARH